MDVQERMTVFSGLRSGALLLVAVVALTLVLAPSADGFVYWANNGGSSIGRANNSGSGVKQSFLSAGTFPSSVAVNRTEAYWVSEDGTAIGHSDLNGNPASIDTTFIEPVDFACGVTADAAHVYWTNNDGTIGRANLDGTGVNQTFVDPGVFTCSLDVAGGFIYWEQPGAGSDDEIGRVALSSPGSPNNNFITGVTDPSGIAVSATHVYWAVNDGTTIGRAPLAVPRTPNNSFIAGANDPCGVALHGARVYWANHAGSGSPSDSIGRANLGGGGVDSTFITGANEPCGVAVNALSVPSCDALTTTAGDRQPVQVKLDCSSGGGTPTYSIASQPRHGQISGFNASTGALTYTPEPNFTGDSFTYKVSNPGAGSNTATATILSNEFTIGKAKKNKKKGTAKLPVIVPGPGELVLEGKKVKGITEQVGAAAVQGAQAEIEAKLKVKARGKGKKKLKKKGKAKVKADVTYTPTGGDPSTKSKKLKLKKRR